MMKEDVSEPFSMGGASIIIIFSTIIMSVIAAFMVATTYKSYKVNENYVAHTQAYYAADGEATVKRALIEEQLYKLYFSRDNIQYDKSHIAKVINNVKDVKIVSSEVEGLLVRYEEPIDAKERLSVELEVKPIQKGKEVHDFTEVKCWQVNENK